MVSWEIHNEAMWYSGVKNPVSFDQAAIIAYTAITNEASTPTTAPITSARPNPIRDGAALCVSARITMHSTMPMVAFESGQYSVPHTLLGQTVWVRVHGRGVEEQVVIVHIGPAGPVEVARHRRANPGSPKITEDHFPPAPAGALDRRPRPKNAADVEFLALGAGAHMWLTEAAAAGSTKMRVKMTQALGLAKLFDPAEVDWALGHAAVHGRFAEADLASILDHHATARTSAEQHRAGEDHSLTQGTSAWAGLGMGLGQPGPREDSDDGVDDGVLA
jgi:hypothetical protein